MACILSSSNWVFASSNQKTVFWWRHIVLKLCLLYSTGVQTPYMLKYKCGTYYGFMKSEFWPRPIRKQYIDDVIEFWKCVHWNPRVPKPLICLNTNVTCIIRDDHQNLKLLSIDLNQMHLIGLVERTILVFKSSKSDVSLQSYGL